MEFYFTVTIRYIDGEVKVYDHVLSSSISYSTHSNFCKFKDKNEKKHIIFGMGATITFDEETPCDAEYALPSDVL